MTLDQFKVGFGVFTAIMAGFVFARGYQQCQTLSPDAVKQCANLCAPKRIASVAIGKCECGQ